MTNYNSPGNVKIEGSEIEEVPENKYLGQTLSTSNTIDIEIATCIRTAWRCFGKYREIFLDNDMPKEKDIQTVHHSSLHLWL